MENKDLMAKARVQVELEELSAKAQKLGDFMGKETFNSLSLVQRILLNEQYKIMRIYMDILNSRLLHWEDKDSDRK